MLATSGKFETVSEFPGPVSVGYSKRNSLVATELDALLGVRAIHRHIKPGQSLITQGESNAHVYVLLQGWVISQKLHEDGSRQILDLVMPGSIIGYNCTLRAGYGFEAKTECHVISVSRDAFSDVLLRSPELCLRCAGIFSAAETRAFERMSHLGRMTARERVAGLIVELASRLQANGVSNIESVAIPLTQQDIADMLGLAHETVCRVLVSFRTRKLTTWRSGKLEIYDVKRLRIIAGYDEVDDDFVALPPAVSSGHARQMAIAA
jgi:CRP/FNR family transcriptional regulator, anaerobic regulatory protein